MPTKSVKVAPKKKKPAQKAVTHKPIKKTLKKVVPVSVIETVKSTVIKPEIAEQIKREKYEYAVGKRKSAIANIRYYTLGTGEVVVNGMALDAYFPFFALKETARRALQLSGWQTGRWSIKIIGGGKSSQAQAAAHGMAKLLQQIDPNLRIVLKKNGLLTRDARVKERKKYGLKRARRAPQWQKR
jgi:small subunit ribosomal protein S9